MVTSVLESVSLLCNLLSEYVGRARVLLKIRKRRFLEGGGNTWLRPKDPRELRGVGLALWLCSLALKFPDGKTKTQGCNSR